MQIEDDQPRCHNAQLLVKWKELLIIKKTPLRRKLALRKAGGCSVDIQHLSVV